MKRIVFLYESARQLVQSPNLAAKGCAGAGVGAFEAWDGNHHLFSTTSDGVTTFCAMKMQQVQRGYLLSCMFSDR